MGHAGAQEKLSAIFLAGSAPVSKDLVEACAWCTMAAKGGNAVARARLPIIKKQLNSDESVGAMQRCQSLRNEIGH